MLAVTALHPIFAAELVGADLTEPPGAGLIATVEAAMARYGVLIVRDADISDAQQIRFSRAFGPLELPSRAPDAPVARRAAPEMFLAGNLDRDGNLIPYATTAQGLARGAERFHTDSSFHAMPTKWSLLRGHETPPPEAGGATWFVDTRAAYDDLPEAMKARIEGLVGTHDFWRGRQLAGLGGEITPAQRKLVPFDPVDHPLVRTMPDGRGALYVGGHCVGIRGMDAEEGLALVEQLYAHATQERYIYRHQWRQHDMAIWDNRCTMHAATPLLSDAWRRDMRRTTINESGPETSAVAWLADQRAA